MSETELGTGIEISRADAPDLRGRAGYDPRFLAPGPYVPLPEPLDGARVEVLDYTHFSVVHRPDRRLAAATVVAIDGSALVDVPRSDDRWFLDPRIGPDEQAGAELYARNDFDRGHLVRRRDPGWGPEAGRANADTFSYANAAPQASTFNQSMELWLGLEDHVLAYARRWDARLVVVTGPVFADDDPEYRGVRVPRRFYKIAAYLLPQPADLDPDEEVSVLASAGFVLDQTPLVEQIVGARSAQQVELGGFRTFQVPVADIGDLTRLDLGPLVAADRLPVLVPAAAGDEVPAWRPLAGAGDLVL
ncbi:DNA/RNA non-specific endonuclease [Kineococcus rhizosphaerae]|uniref:Endonuclease G n=1 Tax=Kineococcus rhizosphaerae TaxID=559628 RepID=A0A2T0R4L3_9ACTN|nr:DNA/RNA non-specific endonuclease [Kineococcus rhizosphaerae]PRY15295.1 endonuclease G [Kineococcus rhizosphaerae]